MLIGALVILFLFVLAIVSSGPTKNQCEEILGGVAMKRCHYSKGHPGPHQTWWNNQNYDFNSNTKMQYKE